MQLPSQRLVMLETSPIMNKVDLPRPPHLDLLLLSHISLSGFEKL